MGNHLSIVKFPDNEYFFTYYQSCADILSKGITKIFRDYDNTKWNKCHCDTESLEDVSVYVTYAGGFYIKGKGCKKCEAIYPEYIETKGLMPWESPPYLEYQDTWIDDYYKWGEVNLPDTEV